MKACILLWSCLFSWASAANSPELARALELEMNRGLEQLALDGEGPPWRIWLELTEQVSVKVRAKFGGVISETVVTQAMPSRALKTGVRQGSQAYDSSDFSGGISHRFERLPSALSPDYLQRKAWMEIDFAYKSAVDALTNKKSVLPEDQVDRPAIAPASLPEVFDNWPELPDLDPEWVRRWTQALSAVLVDYPELEHGESLGSELALGRMSLSSEGLRLNRLDSEIVFRVLVKTRAEDGALLKDSRVWIVRQRTQLPELGEMLDQVRRMAEALIESAKAPVLADYIGPVLFEQPASLEFFGQLILPEILGSPPSVRRSYGKNDLPAQGARTARVGRRILPRGWSIVDDARDPGPGHYLWDDEGVAPTRVVIVEDGVLRQPLMSRTPISMDSRSTGHGLAGPGGRMAMPGRLRIAPGKSVSPRRLEKLALKAAKKMGRDSVLVIRQLESMVHSPNTRRGRSPTETAPGLSAPTQAYLLYTDGRREPVRCARFLGVDRRAMRDVIAAGSVGVSVGRLDAHPSSGRFRRGWTYGVQTGWETPAVLVSELELIGQAGGAPRRLPRLDTMSRLDTVPETGAE